MNRRSFIASTLAAISCLTIFRDRRKLPVPAKRCHEIAAMDVGGDRMVMIASDDEQQQRILYSDDWACTFYIINGPPCDAEMTALASIDAQWWYIGCDDGALWRTEDAGRSWKEIEYDVLG